MTSFEFADLYEGMPSDEAVRRLLSRGIRAIKSGWTHTNQFGLVVLWLFDDGTAITLARDEYPGMYRIQKIEPEKYTYDEIKAMELNTIIPSEEPKKRKRRKGAKER